MRLTPDWHKRRFNDNSRYAAILEQLPVVEKEKVLPHIEGYGFLLLGGIVLVLVTLVVGATALQQRLEFLGAAALISSAGFGAIFTVFSEKKLQLIHRMIDEAATRHDLLDATKEVQK